MDTRVGDEVSYWLSHEFGNAGSRTHAYGRVAKEK